MKQSNLMLILGGILVMYACKKVTDNDLGGTETYNGIAMSVKTLDSRPDTVLVKRKKVYLKASGTQADYFYPVITDENGKFTFENLHNKSYVIEATDTLDNIPYYGSVPIAAGNVLYLYPDQRKINGLIVKLVDTLPIPTPVNNATVYHFVNKLFYDNEFTAGAIDSMKTGPDGRIRYLNIPPGTHYLLAKLAVNNRNLTGKKELMVPSAGIVNNNDTIVMRFR